MSCSVRSVFQVLGVRLQAGGEVLAVRLPRPDVAAIQLEDAKAEVARVRRSVSSLIFVRSRRRCSLVTSAMFRGCFSLSQNAGNLLIFVFWIEGFWKLNQYISSKLLVSHVLQ